MTSRTPEFIGRWLEAGDGENLALMDGPMQFLGDEPNTVLAESGFDRALLWKSRSAVRWLMAASWPYEQAAGNMAIPVVYWGINDGDPSWLADRWYLPATPRDLGILERAGLPAWGIETRHQLTDFDVVGTSVSYPVLAMNYAKTLAMSGVPLRWRDRQEQAADYPMVMAGGQAYSAPEFISPMLDCFWLGEVEDEPGNPGGISDFCAVIASMKADGAWAGDRLGCYERLARQFPHVYFPRFTEFTYKYQDRGLPETTLMVSGMASSLGLTHRARQVRDLNAIAPFTRSPLLYSDPGMGSGDVEVGRGCTCWCSFCKLSWVTKPYRQRSVPYVLASAKRWRLNMGSLDISLVAPDPPVHTQLKALIAGIMEQVTPWIDASSMRIDDFTSEGAEFARLLKAAGQDSLTLGLEAGSQRLRDVAGKGTSDDEVVRAVTAAIRCGIRKIKIYFITNWPGEEAADVMRVVELGRRLADVRESFGADARGVRIQFSYTPLIVEAQTPLQWFAVTAPDYTLQAALSQLSELHIDKKLGSKASPAKLAFFQACQRASRRAGEAIVDVLEELDRASWGGFPKDMRERLDAALARRGFRNGLEDLFGERYREDLFGWEHIKTGVSAGLMWRAYRDMVDLLENTDAETYDEDCEGEYRGVEWVQRCDEGCAGNTCGACSREDLELRRDYIRDGRQERDLRADPVTPLDHSTVACRIRVKTSRPRAHRMVSNEFYQHLIRRAAFRAVEEIGGCPPIAAHTVRLASDNMVYRDRTDGAEYIEFGVTRWVSPARAGWIVEVMGRELAPWMELAPGPEPFALLPADAQLPVRPLSLWELPVDRAPEDLAALLAAWDAAEKIPVRLRKESFYGGEVPEDGDAKDHVQDMWAVRDGHQVRLRMLLRGRLGPYQAYAALAGMPSWIGAARQVATRVDFFRGEGQACLRCGRGLPAGLLDEVFDMDFCPRCKDEDGGQIVAGLARARVLPDAAWSSLGPRNRQQVGRELWKTPAPLSWCSGWTSRFPASTRPAPAPPCWSSTAPAPSASAGSAAAPGRTGWSAPRTPGASSAWPSPPSRPLRPGRPSSAASAGGRDDRRQVLVG